MSNVLDIIGHVSEIPRSVLTGNAYERTPKSHGRRANMGQHSRIDYKGEDAILGLCERRSSMSCGVQGQLRKGQLIRLNQLNMGGVGGRRRKHRCDKKSGDKKNKRRQHKVGN